MQNADRERDAHHLITQILNRNEDVPNYALLLGAGASVTSGVKSAQDMILDWRSEQYERIETDKSLDDWIGEQFWYGHDDEYSILFEMMYDQPSQRRVFIEECVKPAHPTWGYVYLSNLLANKIFNVVLTTNFDDLVNEACYLYSEGVRPMVAAHDSAVSNVRLISARPKIIKLHGDFMYDNIKNSVRESETLEANTQQKFKQIAQEYGLVVIGYGGRDRSVVDTLDLLLRDEEYFEHGVYWCMRRGETPSNRLKVLLRRDRVYPVVLDGFDEFMADLHNKAQLKLPDSLARPFRVAHDRAQLFVKSSSSLKRHPVISRDIDAVLQELDKSPQDLLELIPASLMAFRYAERGDFENALKYWEQALEETPRDTRVAYEYGKTLALLKRVNKLEEFVKNAPIDVVNKSYFLLLAGGDEGVVEFADEMLGSNPRDELLMINRAIALKRLGRNEDLESQLKRLDDLIQDKRRLQIGRSAIGAGIAALKNDKTLLMENLRKAMRDGYITIEDTQLFPVFEDYRDDPEFNEVIRESILDAKDSDDTEC